MIDFSKLKNVSLQTVKRPAAARAATPKLPEGPGLLRVFHTGKIFPSQELATEANLEYAKRVHAIAEDPTTPLEPVNNGLDIYSSKQWNMFPAEIEQEYILANVVAKKEAKVSVFGSTKYDKETGEPTTSVLTQGTQSFVKDELLEMISRVFLIDWSKVSYVDLKMSAENAMAPHPTNVYFLPKMITKGAKAGTASYVRREDISVMPLELVNTVEKTESQLQAEATRAAKKAEAAVAKETEGTLDMFENNEAPVATEAEMDAMDGAQQAEAQANAEAEDNFFDNL